LPPPFSSRLSRNNLLGQQGLAGQELDTAVGAEFTKVWDFLIRSCQDRVDHHRAQRDQLSFDFKEPGDV
jgi:hypothetical protein